MTSRNDLRSRHPRFTYAPERHIAPAVGGVLARVGAWCADHFAFVTFVVLGTAFLAGMATGATL